MTFLLGLFDLVMKVAGGLFVEFGVVVVVAVVDCEEGVSGWSGEWGGRGRLGTVLVVHGELALQLFADVLHLVFLVGFGCDGASGVETSAGIRQWMAGITRILALQVRLKNEFGICSD